MPVKNARSDDGQPFSRIDFFTEMGRCCIIAGSPVNKGLGTLHMSSAK
jgi:hypothetical protein